MPQLYETFNKSLYRITGISVEEDTGSAVLDGIVNPYTSTDPSQIGSGTYVGNFEVSGGYIQSANFVTGVSGWRLDSNGDFEGNDGTFRGTVSASAIDIPDAVTANSFHVDSSGNTWWGATTLASSNASVTAAGIVTAIGITSLNMKAYTTFETAGRFITTSGGTGASTFGNQGVTIAPGATATSYSRTLWWITQYVFNNNPYLNCSLLALSGFASGDGRAFFGMGNPTVDGSAFTVTGTNYCGFILNKVSGTTTLVASQCDGSGSRASSNLITIANSDSLELYIKMISGTSVKYYYRKNGGTLTLGATLTTFLPTGSETYIQFSSSNIGSANDFQVQFQCAAYEH